MEEFKILKDLVKFNTIKDKENKEIINYIEKYLKKLGFKTEYKTKNLIMSIGEDSKLGFLGHTDTVEYIEEFKNPFDLTLKNGFLYGLGSCDMKGGIAAMLDTVSQIDFKKLKSGMKLYFTYDEEIGFGGVQEIVGTNEKFPDIMIFGEPTNNVIYTGHKGLLEYEIYFKGLKAHSSNPAKGISANMNAVKFLNELDSFYQDEIKKDEIKFYEIPYTTMNVGTINGGSAKNSVSAFCDISIDFRIADEKHVPKIINKINELANKYNAEVNIIEKTMPFADSIDFVEKIKTTNFMTEAGKVAGCKRIILGTGPVTAHEVNENISVKSYNKLIDQYKSIIYKVCK